MEGQDDMDINEAIGRVTGEKAVMEQEDIDRPGDLFQLARDWVLASKLNLKLPGHVAKPTNVALRKPLSLEAVSQIPSKEGYTNCPMFRCPLRH